MLSTNKPAGSALTRSLIAVTGGIGSGKSMVCAMLRAMGYEVYDSDSRAKMLMDKSQRIKHEISDRISSDVVLSDGTIDRRRLSEIVFSDDEKLNILNGIVHSAVRDDLRIWAEQRRVAFVETAILYQSGLDAMVDEVWSVEAPKQIRIERVMKRNSFSSTEVESRIEAQEKFMPATVHPSVHILVNDGFIAVLPQVEMLLRRRSL